MLAHLLILAASAAPADYFGEQQAWMPDEPATPSKPDDSPYAGSFRLQLGLGLLAYNASLGGEWWLGENVGIGAGAAAFGVSKLFSGSANGYGAGPHLAFRTSGSGSYGLLLLGGGVAGYSSTHTDGLCGVLDFNGSGFSDCDPPRHDSGAAPMFNGGLGWVWHPGRVELGPMLRADATEQVVAVTLNVTVGFAAR